MKNVQLEKDLKFASHVVFKEALKEWCIREKHDFEYKHNVKWRVTVVCKKKKICIYIYLKNKLNIYIYDWKISASQTQMGDC